MHEGEEDPQLALVACRVLAVFEPEVEVQPLGDLLHSRLVDAAAQRTEVTCDVAAAQATKLRQLAGYVADLALDLDRIPHAVMPENRSRSASRMDKAHQQADGRALAGAVRPKVAEDLSVGHLEV